jgi:hypothetical protein
VNDPPLIRCARCNVPHGVEVRRSMATPGLWVLASANIFRGATRNRAWRMYTPVALAVVSASTGLCEACAKTPPPPAA